MAAETDATADATDGDSDEGSFWTRPVYAFAALIFLLRTPVLLNQETTAGLVGALFGLALGALAFAGVLKLLWIGGERVVGRLDPR